MKMQAHDNALETNAEVQSQDFGIGDASVVIEILRNRLYQHKIRTLTQEYMCNGRDAQRENKSKKRLVVTVPNRITPVFKVRDFGPGITPDRMAKVFVLYGASTKRGTNGQTGGFGIGAKSAWSYTDSFTIVSVVNGKKRTYVAHTGVNNQGRLDLISTDNTDEENGTEIQVAVKPNDINEFRESIFRASHFWSDAEMPEFRGVTALDIPKREVGLTVGQLEIVPRNLPNYIGVGSYGNDRCSLIIDGIPYPVDSDLVDHLNHLDMLLNMSDKQMLIHIGNGEVEVSASRESIADSEVTRTNLNKLAFKAYQDLVSHIKKEFKAVKTNSDWIKTYHTLSKLVRVDDHSTYGDYRIERNAIYSKLFSQVSMTICTVRTTRRSKKTNVMRDEGRFIPLDKVDKVFFKDVADSSVIEGRRVREYLETAGNHGMVLITTKTVSPIKDASGKVTNADHVVTLKESQKALDKIVKDFGGRILSVLPFTPVVREPKAKRDRTKEMFTMHVAHSYGKSPRTQTLEQLMLTPNEKYLYVRFEEYSKFESEFKDICDYLHDHKLSVCAMTDASIEMVENSGLFQSYKEWKADFKADAKTLIAAKSKKANNYKAMRLLERADVKIKDKHVAGMIADYRGLTDRASLPDTIVKMISKDIEQFIEDDKKLTELFKDSYPLVNVLADVYEWRIKAREANEIVAYINGKQ